MAMQEQTDPGWNGCPGTVWAWHPRAVGAAPHDRSRAALVRGLDCDPVAALGTATPAVGSNLRCAQGSSLGSTAELQSPLDLCGSNSDTIRQDFCRHSLCHSN
jgi:hypothetical protein